MYTFSISGVSDLKDKNLVHSNPSHKYCIKHAHFKSMIEKMKHWLRNIPHDWQDENENLEGFGGDPQHNKEDQGTGVYISATKIKNSPSPKRIFSCGLLLLKPKRLPCRSILGTPPPARGGERKWPEYIPLLGAGYSWVNGGFSR